MDHTYVINELERNKSVFRELLSRCSEKLRYWKTQPEKWNLLEVVCHLYDEERDDFRSRVRHVLETPHQPMPAIDPAGWVTSRKYSEKKYDSVLDAFLAERSESVKWLRSLKEPHWTNVYQHPSLGNMSAELFLNNWLAHDYLHFRQITRIKFEFLKQLSGTPMDYAGNW
ncbi:MAG TPA: DinB family protein [Bacteroidia bacterium]|nr:DinB family protein [Bacteroidia bacterium]